MRELPNNAASERAVLASCLLRHDLFSEVRAGLNTEHFFDPKHQAVFEALKGLSGEGSGFDLPLVLERVKGKVTAHELAQILDGHPIVDVGPHIRSIRQSWVRRTLMRLGSVVTNRAKDGQDDIRDLLNEIGSDLQSIYTEFENRILDWKTCLSSTYEEIGEAQRVGTVPGVSTHLDILNSYIGGLRPGRLYVIGARPGVGKTALQCNLAHSWVHGGKKQFWASAEMATSELVSRIVSLECGVAANQIVNSPQKLTQAEMAKIGEAFSALEKGEMVVWDDPTILTERLFLEVASAKQVMGGLDVVMVDYIQLLETKRKTDTRAQHVAQVTRDLKAIAKKFQVPVLATAQIDRQADSREPELGDFSESSQIEKEADVGILMYQDEQSHIMKIAKNRQGPKGKIRLLFDAQHMYFQERPDNLPF